MKLVRCTDRSSPHQLSIHSLNMTTSNLGRSTGRCPINHSCLQYSYTKLGRCTGRSTSHSIIDALKYCYSKLCRCTGRSTHQSSIHAFEYHYTKLGTCTRQMYPSPIKHRYLQYHYTKLGRCTGRSTLAIQA